MLNTLDIYNSLNSAYGPAVWWSDNAYTVMVEAILVQNTSWSSVEKVMQTLPQELTPLIFHRYPMWNWNLLFDLAASPKERARPSFVLPTGSDSLNMMWRR